MHLNAQGTVRYGVGETQTKVSKLVNEAMQAQNELNLVLVDSMFRQMLLVLSEYTARHGKSDDWRNQHPLCVMYINKLNILAGVRVDESFGKGTMRKAYLWCLDRMGKDHSTLEY